MLKKIMVLLSLLFMVLYAIDTTTEESKESQSKKGEAMQKENIMSHKDGSFGFKIEAKDVLISVSLNGFEVFSDMHGQEVNSFMPVNPFITSGKNELLVELFGSKGNKINALSQCKVQLYYINDVLGIKQVIFTLEFDNMRKKERLKGSSLEGIFSAIPNEYSPIKIGQAEEYITLKGLNKGSTQLTQELTLTTPFPRWKFLDSEEILEKPYYKMTSKEYEDFKDSPKMTELYALQKQLLDALVKRDVKSIMPLFKERNEEMDIAYHDPIGSTEEELFRALSAKANNPKYEVYFYDKGKRNYYVEENNKIGYISKAIIFNKKDKSGSSTFHVKCRYEKGKWIITR